MTSQRNGTGQSKRTCGKSCGWNVKRIGGRLGKKRNFGKFIAGSALREEREARVAKARRQRGRRANSGPLEYTYCMAPLSSMMNSIQGPQEGKPQERRSADKEEAQNNDKATVKGCKSKTLSLPFSVESLISDRTTTRTLYTSSESGISPTSGADERLRLSPMALYSDRKLPVESVNNISDCKRGDMDELSNKGQSSWFQTPSYASPPSKCSEFKTLYLIGCSDAWDLSYEETFLSKKFLHALVSY